VRCSVATICLVTCFAGAARAEPWYRGTYGKNRVANVSLTAATGLAYVFSETTFKSDLESLHCHWCDPPSIDVHVRNALVWDDRNGARLASNLTGYVAAPIFVIGISTLTSTSGTSASWGRTIDDVLPILETVTISEVVVQALKFGVARQRPFVHFDPPTTHDVDDNVSFASGHSALTFGLVTSAGLIAHRRGYRSEPYIWIVGGTLAVSTAYLRIAGDKHYFTDVLTGSAIGVAAGLTVPLLMCRPRAALTVLPTRNGVALTGTF
jgi:membrane-associated phospholipid phosphatase